MSLDEVLSNGGHQNFAEPLGSIPNFGFTDASYWFHVQLKADPRLATRWLLEIGYPLLTRSTFTSFVTGFKASHTIPVTFSL